MEVKKIIPITAIALVGGFVFGMHNASDQIIIDPGTGDITAEIKKADIQSVVETYYDDLRNKVVVITGDGINPEASTTLLEFDGEKPNEAFLDNLTENIKSK